MFQIMKEYRVSIIIILFMTIIVVFNINGKSCAHNTKDSITQVQSSERSIHDVDIPILPKNIPSQILRRTSYITSYNKETKLPNWVAWHLTAEHATGFVPRPQNAWREDEEVPRPRATYYDYKGSGWTRGHMCPAGDNKWSSYAMYDTFLFTNCCPQNGNLNSGDWNQIEMSCRRWAEKYGDIYIVCGPVLFRQEHERIGENRVVVPEAFFKVVICLNGKPKGIGFICRNTSGGRNRDFYVNSIRQVERITGITFFPYLPKEIDIPVKDEVDLEAWDHPHIRQ